MIQDNVVSAENITKFLSCILKKVVEYVIISYNFYTRRFTLMMYPYATLNDDTEISHSEMLPDGRVKVYI